MVTIAGATCLDCVNLTLSGGTGPYSEETPGEPLEWRCREGMYEIDGGDFSRAMIRARVRLAETCPKFQAVEGGTPEPRCTAVGAKWCPLHGKCQCGQGDDDYMDDFDCPLHGINVGHAQ